MNKKGVAVIIGAGPGGLTTAHELLKRTDIKPIVIEESAEYVGGISRTVNYKGNRMDIGGHRFFSKSERIMRWWLSILPLADSKNLQVQAEKVKLLKRLNIEPASIDADKHDRIILLRERRSHILYGGQLFDYPISASFDTLFKLGIIKTIKIVLSYLWACFFSKKSPKNLEEFYISRFGKELYKTFFRSYTEKVWGVVPSKISAEWGAQRVKGLSLSKAAMHMARSLLPKTKSNRPHTETSLIEFFLYPKYGPGHLWEEVRKDVESMGGQMRMGYKVTRLNIEKSRIVSIEIQNTDTKEVETVKADYVFSTAAVKDLMEMMDPAPPSEVEWVGKNLEYRDFITVGVLLKKLSPLVQNSADSWMYIQEPDVKLARIQIFNNWSPYLVEDPSTVWLGLEYFAFEDDGLWRSSDRELIDLATNELTKIGFASKENVIDATVVRMKKAYPAYFGSYAKFQKVQEYLDLFENLFPIGRNGMHKYNNQDHSMLTAMTAVDNLIEGRIDKSNIWAVNTERVYHEEK
jgi:protoporphyrinogen oxidase